MKETKDGRELTVAIVGAGFMGDTHAYGYRRVRSLRAPPVVLPNLRKVVDIDAGAARSLAARWGVPEWSTDWEGVVADDGIDLVDVCTTPDVHREIGVAAAEAGKSVYCEKPVGRNVGETAALAAAIRDGGVFGYVGFTYRWTPAVVLARSLIAGGRIGEIREIHFGYQSSPFADANRPWYWKFAEDAGGGGALADQGSHAFDMARFLVGEVSRVSGYTRIAVPQRPDPDADGAWRHARGRERRPVGGVCGVHQRGVWDFAWKSGRSWHRDRVRVRGLRCVGGASVEHSEDERVGDLRDLAMMLWTVFARSVSVLSIRFTATTFPGGAIRWVSTT